LLTSASAFSLENPGEKEPEAGTRIAFTYNGVEFAFRYCPGSPFNVGSPTDEEGRDDDERLYEEPFIRGFWMQETEVTQAQWKAMKGKKKQECAFIGKNLPVETVNWDECMTCVWDFTERLKTKKARITLPTEAQWERACRAGTETPFFWGNALNGDAANCDGSQPYGTLDKGVALGKTTPAGSYAPNPWGLYDMNGNVAEWQRDHYDKYPLVVDEETVRETFFTDKNYRVIRGGSWQGPAKDCRSADRNKLRETRRRKDVGFRLILNVGKGVNVEQLMEELTNAGEEKGALESSVVDKAE